MGSSFSVDSMPNRAGKPHFEPIRQNAFGLPVVRPAATNFFTGLAVGCNGTRRPSNQRLPVLCQGVLDGPCYSLPRPAFADQHYFPS